MNHLKELPELPNSLKKLYCGNNLLKKLPNLPNSLIYLSCYQSQLTILPKLPNNLIDLCCGNNQLTIIPNLPNSLRILFCYNNQLTILPILPNLIKDYYYDGNPVYDYIKNKCGGNLELYYKENKIFANKIGEWFLECKYNPKYKYCRDRVDKEYDKLF